MLLVATGCDLLDGDSGSSRPSVLIEVEPDEGPAPLEVAFSALPRDDVGDDPEFTYTTFVDVFGPDDDGTSTPVEFEEWQSVINAACATSSEDAAAVPGDPTSPEALAALVEIDNAETEAVESAGIPRHRRDEALDWLALRNRASNLFVDLAENPPTTTDDPRPAELQALGQELSDLSEQLGLTDCVADQ